jgi:hypothetical protein
VIAYSPEFRKKYMRFVSRTRSAVSALASVLLSAAVEEATTRLRLPQCHSPDW